VRQVVYPVDRERKRELLSHLIRTGRIDRRWCSREPSTARIAWPNSSAWTESSPLRSTATRAGQRVRALDDFKAGRVAILVATEVASRGLDIEGLPHVVNFELPMVAQDYVHRIGRTGRAGMEGDAVSLVCIDENMLLDDIQSLLRQPIRREVVPGFEVNRSIRANRSASAATTFADRAMGGALRLASSPHPAGGSGSPVRVDRARGVGASPSGAGPTASRRRVPPARPSRFPTRAERLPPGHPAASISPCRSHPATWHRAHSADPSRAISTGPARTLRVRTPPAARRSGIRRPVDRWVSGLLPSTAHRLDRLRENGVPGTPRCPANASRGTATARAESS